MKFTGYLPRILLVALIMSAMGNARAASGMDLTQDYLNAFDNDCAFGSAQINALRKYKVLMVPGFLSELNPTYFADQQRWLASIKVAHEKVAVKSGQGIKVNGPIVAAAIRDSAKPVILITHSKGSVDALEALVAEPLLRKQVKGWVSLQGAFLGSPIADKVLDGSMLNPIAASIILGFFGGTQESAQGLTTAASLAYYREHTAEINKLLRDIPTIAFASTLDNAPSARAVSMLDFPYELMARDGIRNDGLVPLDAAMLPGMDYVKISGIDHIAPVMPALQRFDRVRLSKALLLALRSPLRGLPGDKGCKTKR